MILARALYEVGGKLRSWMVIALKACTPGGMPSWN